MGFEFPVLKVGTVHSLFYFLQTKSNLSFSFGKRRTKIQICLKEKVSIQVKPLKATEVCKLSDQLYLERVAITVDSRLF